MSTPVSDLKNVPDLSYSESELVAIVKTKVSDLKKQVLRKRYLPQELKMLLVEMTSEKELRPSSKEALAKAENLFKNLYGKEKPWRIRDTPQCIQACTTLKCAGEGSKSLESCKVDTTATITATAPSMVKCELPRSTFRT